MSRLRQIRERLEREFAPTELEIVDEGHRHTGHPGTRDGRGHFRIRIVSNRFVDAPRLARHRMIYAALADLLETDIHALSVTALTSTEDRQRQ